MSSPSSPYLLNPLGEPIPLDNPTTLIGRAADCAIVIADARASRRHAEICRAGDAEAGFVLRDLDSRNGTRLNDRELRAPARLQDGDVIEIAGARFTFRDPDTTLETLHFPRLWMDETTGEIWVNRRAVQLSAEQRALFRLLWARRNQVCSKDEIARAVWRDCQGDIFDYQIESLVKRLRDKLEPDPAHPVLLVTARGLGYRLVT